jgi:arylsulfatase
LNQRPIPVRAGGVQIIAVDQAESDFGPGIVPSRCITFSEDDIMRMRVTLTTAAVLAAGALLGWLAAAGRLTPWAHADEKQGPASPKGGAGLSPILPPPETPFDGIIGRTYKDSKMSKIPVVKAPAGAPNVLLILIDDCGFGQWGTFGGQVPTPNLDKLAKNGLRYTRYHTTALCSPTRAALLTGRNHHSAATG